MWYLTSLCHLKYNISIHINIISSFLVGNTIKDFNAYAGKDIVLNCGITELNFKKIGWQINDANKPGVTYESNLEYPLEILQQNLTGRVDINPQNVNQLRIKNLSLKDAGKYHCFIISNGAAVEKNTYNLQINGEWLNSCFVHEYKSFCYPSRWT